MRDIGWLLRTNVASFFRLLQKLNRQLSNPVPFMGMAFVEKLPEFKGFRIGIPVKQRINLSQYRQLLGIEMCTHVNSTADLIVVVKVQIFGKIFFYVDRKA